MLLLSQVKEVSVMTLKKAASSHELVSNRLYYETEKTEMWMPVSISFRGI